MLVSGMKQSGFIVYIIYIIFQILFILHKLLQVIECSSLGYTVNPCYFIYRECVSVNPFSLIYPSTETINLKYLP